VFAHCFLYSAGWLRRRLHASKFFELLLRLDGLYYCLRRAINFLCIDPAVLMYAAWTTSFSSPLHRKIKSPKNQNSNNNPIIYFFLKIADATADSSSSYSSSKIPWY
jgi:hypothetical protein